MQRPGGLGGYAGICQKPMHWGGEGKTRVPMRAVGLRGMTSSPEVIPVPPLPPFGSVTLGKSLSFSESRRLHLKHEAFELMGLKELLSSPGLFTFIEVPLLCSSMSLTWLVLV